MDCATTAMNFVRGFPKSDFFISAASTFSGKFNGTSNGPGNGASCFRFDSTGVLKKHYMFHQVLNDLQQKVKPACESK